MRFIRCEADLEAAISDLLLIDPRFSRIAELAGKLPLRKASAGFEGLAAIIVAQMVSRASADAIWNRLVAHTGGVSVDAIVSCTDVELRNVGLSGAKVKTLRALASACRDGLEPASVAVLPVEDAIAALTAIHGIGRWTAEVYLLFAAGHPDVFPSGDVALQAAMAHALSLEARPVARKAAEISGDWSPCRSIAARLLWAYYAVEMKRGGIPVAIG